MISKRTALMAVALAALVFVVPALAGDLNLPREKVEFVAPPFVHSHEQATKEGPKILEFRLVAEEKEMVIDDEGTKLRAMTFNPETLVNWVMSSLCTPSAKNSLSLSVERLLKGRTATERSASLRATRRCETKYQISPGAAASRPSPARIGTRPGRRNVPAAGARSILPSRTSNAHARPTTAGNPSPSATTT